MSSLNKRKHYLWSCFTLFSCACIALIFLQFVDGRLQLVQERAEVKYANPNYVTGVSVFTSRRRRGAPYTTNITGTILQPWGNNVTFRLSYILDNGNAVDLNIRCCDVLGKPWIVEFAKQFSNITACPAPAGTYRYYNIEIPPKNFPLPMPDVMKGDSVKLYVHLFLTRSKELIFKMIGTVRVK